MSDRPTMWDRFAEFMGWHEPSEGQLNPASESGHEAKCVRCGERLLMDSQGNWFTVGPPGDGELVTAYLDGISPPASDRHEAHIRGLRAASHLGRYVPYHCPCPTCAKRRATRG